MKSTPGLILFTILRFRFYENAYAVNDNKTIVTKEEWKWINLNVNGIHKPIILIGRTLAINLHEYLIVESLVCNHVGEN
jgi:hypothetical protein